MGRPLGDDVETCLPRGSELLIPVSDSADSDLFMSDRYRPSPEQAAAQKGVQRFVFKMIV